MPNPISRFVTFVLGSRLARLLFIVHLILAVYVVYRLPLANPDTWDWGGGCHGIPLADRTLFYCDASGLLNIIATLDFIAVVLFAAFATFFGGLWGPSISFHTVSWAVALVLLGVTSLQWLIVGSCLEWFFLKFVRKGSHV
jgi:hypothetical protein